MVLRVGLHITFIQKSESDGLCTNTVLLVRSGLPDVLSLAKVFVHRRYDNLCLRIQNSREFTPCSLCDPVCVPVL